MATKTGLEPTEIKKHKKLQGKVLKKSADKTISVEVLRMAMDLRLHKARKTTKKYLVHDQDNRCKVGDIVKIQEVRPLSKRKNFALVEIVSSQV